MTILRTRAAAGLAACVLAITMTAATSASPSHPLLSSADVLSFAALSASLGGHSGIAVSELGLDRTPVVTGRWRSGAAWSSIKVAIAVAVYDRADGHPDAATRALLRRAITASDNDAAQKLWNKLGGGSRAAAAVQDVLAAAGDTRTRVQPTVTRPGYTAFGQTVWSLADQARFTAGLPCLPNAAPVIALMNEVIAAQRWGLGSAGRPAKFKAGWGPSRSGAYLVRQMGLVKLGSKTVAVTIATVPADGSFDAGARNLTRIARWLATHVDASSVPAQPAC